MSGYQVIIPISDHYKSSIRHGRRQVIT